MILVALETGIAPKLATELVSRTEVAHLAEDLGIRSTINGRGPTDQIGSLSEQYDHATGTIGSWTKAS